MITTRAETRGPNLKQVKEWRRDLGRILGEMEETFGDNPAGTYPSKLECLTRFAWSETHEEERRILRRALAEDLA